MPILVADASPGVGFLWAHRPSASLSPLQYTIDPAGAKSSTSLNKSSAGFSGFPFIHGLIACNCYNHLFVLLVRVSSFAFNSFVLVGQAIETD